MLLQSCGGETEILRNGVTKVPRDKKYFKNRTLFSKDLLNGIDTTAVYVERYGYLADKKNFIPLNKERSYRSDYWFSALKFYSNGAINYFSLPSGTLLDDSIVDPNFAGSRGILYRDKGGAITMDHFTIIGYSLGAVHGIDESYLSVNADTIFIKRKRNPEKILVYIKQKPRGKNTFKANW